MAAHPLQHAVVAGRYMLMAHGPVASLLEVKGEQGGRPAPPTWLGKPAFFLAIAGVVLWNVYGSKQRDGWVGGVLQIDCNNPCTGPTQSSCCSAWQRRARGARGE